MIGGRKSRSNKGKKRTPYGPRSRTRSGAKFRGRKLEKKVKSNKVFSNNVSNVTNNAPVIRAGTNVRPTFNTMNKAQRKRKVRSNKGKKRGPYGPHSRTRSGKKFKVRGGSHKHCSQRTALECVSNISNSRCEGVVQDLRDPLTRVWTKSTVYGSNGEFGTKVECDANTLSSCESNPCFVGGGDKEKSLNN